MTCHSDHIMRRSQAVKAGSFEVPIAKVRFFPAQFIWAYGEIWQHAVALGATVERRGGSSPLTPTTVMNRCCSWLNSFDHYYSQLASDGAVVLCKLGSYMQRSYNGKYISLPS